MKLVLDTNILLKALIRNSKVRAVLLSPNHQLFVPEHAVEETRRHFGLIMKKTGLSEDEVELVLGILLTNLHVIPSKDIMANWKGAEEIMVDIDRSDTPFVAAALSLPCDGIWSDDLHLKRQKKVKVWNTKEVLGLL